MRGILERVTITGADDSIDPDVLFVLAGEYPFVEFGILLSAGRLGQNRFPSQHWVNELVRRATNPGEIDIGLSGHICGRWVDDIFMGRWPSYLTQFRGAFDRWQLNTHGKQTDFYPPGLEAILRDRNDRGETVIFQFDDVNARPLHYASNVGCDVAALFDLSHGAGVLPKSWPPLLKNIPCGYAGGLSPENVAAQLEAIEPLIDPGRHIWIDAETRVRSFDDSVFEVDLVRAFLDAAKPWVAE